MQDNYQIKLPLFEGPMDLLLHLIRENKIDIYDIPISLITRQYLEYIEMMKEFNLEVAGDFIVMAATLIHIKSRMLLPVEDTADVEELEDPRLELVMKLLEYQSFRDAAHELKDREEKWSDVGFRTAIYDAEDEEEEDEGSPALFDLNMFDLLTAFQKMLAQAPPEARRITRETLTIKDRLNYIIETLAATDAIRFVDLFKDADSITHYVVTFVALLESIKLGLAKAYQEKEFGVIWIINPEAHIDLKRLRTIERLSLTAKGKKHIKPSFHIGLYRPTNLPLRSGLPKGICQVDRENLPVHVSAKLPSKRRFGL